MKHYLILCLLIIYFENNLASIIIAAKSYSNGIILGCDSYTISGGIIQSRNTERFFPIIKKQNENDNEVYMCNINNDSDFQDLYQNILDEILIHEKFQYSISIRGLAKFARNIIHRKYKNCHCLITGKSKGEYQIIEILPNGNLIEHEDYVAAGSGSVCIWAMLQSFYENINKVDIENVQKTRTLVENALRIAISNDPLSGGIPKVKYIP